MPLAPHYIDAIVTAMLAVNKWSVADVEPVLPELRRIGLTDAPSVANEDLGSLTVKLASAGYDRGTLTSLLAFRLKALMTAVKNGDLDRIPALVARGDRNAVAEVLQQVNGIGPKVAANAWALLTR